MFSTPSMMASGRSTGWRQTKRAPSAISSRSRVDPAGAAPAARKLPRSGPGSRPRPGRRPRAAPRATARPAAASRPPRGGPMKVLATSSTANSRLLARVRSSRGTSAGSSDWAEVSNRVSATPSSTATAYSMARVATSAATARARPPEQHGPDQVDPDHRLAPVQPVGEGPGHRGQQPGEPGGDGDPGDQQRRPGELHGQQRQGDPQDPVGQVGEAGGDQRLVEVPSQIHAMDPSPLIWNSQSIEWSP